MFKTKLYLFLLVTTIFAFNVFAQDEAEKQGKEIFDKYQAAIGTGKVKTVETITEFERMGTKYKTTTIEDRANGKNYTVTEGGIEGKQESGFDGKRRWMKNNFTRGYQDNNSSSSISLSAGKILKHIKLPNEKIDGKDYLVVSEIAENPNIKTTAYYDPETFLLFQRKANIQVQGMNIDQTTVYSDYRKIGETLVPFKEAITNQSGKITRQKVSVRYDFEVDPKIFEYSDGDKKEEKKADTKEDKSPDPAIKQPMMVKADGSTTFKDEDGKIITQSEFFQKRNSGNYATEPEMTNGKLVGMRLKKGNAETAIGATPPDFTGIMLDDSTIQLSQLKGKVVVLNFWFAACAPCIKEVPELNELVNKYQGKEVEFLSVTYDPKDIANEFVKKYKFNYKHIVDAQNIIDSYKVNSFPTHLVIDREGKIKLAQFGYQTGIMQNLTKNIDEALAAKKSSWDKMNPDAIVPEDIKKQTFETVWKKVNESYWDSTFNGVDWNAVKTKYEPQLATAKTNRELTNLLTKMVGELKVSHFKVGSASEVSINGANPNNIKTGSVGLAMRLLDNSELVVSNVREASPAAQAGIKNGYVIKKVDGETIESIAQKRKAQGGFQLRDEFEVMRAVSTKLSGDLDKKVSITYLDENDVEKTVELTRKNFGSRTDLILESKELNQDVGYIKFNIFFGDLPTKFADALSTMQNKKALIVDLRGNPGGVGNFTTTLAAMLDKEKRSLGVSQYRYNKVEFAYEGNDKSFNGKLFILLDEASASSSEVFAGGLQSNKRAIIIGNKSAGAVLPATSELLPNGGGLQFPIANFTTPDGNILEGRGVTPDVEVKLTRKDLLAGRDLAIETALKTMKNLDSN